MKSLWFGQRYAWPDPRSHLPHLANSFTRVAKHCVKLSRIIERIRVEHIPTTTSALDSYSTEIAGSELTWMRRLSSRERMSSSL